MYKECLILGKMKTIFGIYTQSRNCKPHTNLLYRKLNETSKSKQYEMIKKCLIIG